MVSETAFQLYRWSADVSRRPISFTDGVPTLVGIQRQSTTSAD
ncbi:hypothetical protein [Candidatus Viridilinea mediisalina]|nr:hypothetical protein [Candidatus Viridilinea mediisalina]